MAIVVENGTIVTGANSYVSGDELVTYAGARGITITAPSVPGPEPIAPTTSYIVAGGAGNRVSLIDTTSTVLWGDGYTGPPSNLLATVDNLVDGSFLAAVSGAILFPYTSWVAGNWIQFDFKEGVKKYIDTFRITTAGVTALGTWKIEASDDGSTWITQKDDFSWTRGSAVEFSFTPTSPLGFRYWRMLKVTTDGSLGDWCVEFDFKIAPGADATPEILDSTAEDLIVKAMDYIEGLDFIGVKFTKEQPLQWPRGGAIIDGYVVDGDEIPDELKKGLMESALATKDSQDPLQNIDRTTISESVGPISVTYTSGASATTLVRKINNALWKLLKSTANQFPVRRA